MGSKQKISEVDLEKIRKKYNKKYSEMDEYGRYLLRCRINLDEVLYRHTQNPLFILEVYRTCREHELAIPDSVLEYLDEATDNLFNDKYFEKGNKAGSILVESFKFSAKGANTMFNRYQKWIRDITVLEMYNQKEYENDRRLLSSKIAAALNKKKDKEKATAQKVIDKVPKKNILIETQEGLENDYGIILEIKTIESIIRKHFERDTKDEVVEALKAFLVSF